MEAQDRKNIASHGRIAGDVFTFQFTLEARFEVRPEN